MKFDTLALYIFVILSISGAKTPQEGNTCIMSILLQETVARPIAALAAGPVPALTPAANNILFANFIDRFLFMQFYYRYDMLSQDIKKNVHQKTGLFIAVYILRWAYMDTKPPGCKTSIILPYPLTVFSAFCLDNLLV